MTTDGTAHRELGARGSRSSLAVDLGTDTPNADALLATVPAWWAAQAAASGLSGRWLDLSHAVRMPNRAFTSVPRVDAVFMTAEELGEAYVLSLDSAVRNRHGRHYTPPALAKHLWHLARRPLTTRNRPAPLPGLVRDPACGAGVLLLPALREHLAATERAQPELVLRSLPELFEGTDLDPDAAWLCAVILAAECLPLLARVPESRRQPLPALAHVADGLDDPTRPAKVVLMNPPYGRVKLSADERARFDHMLTGHPNLYGMFIGHHAEHLAEGGVLAALVPTSFTAGRYSTALRAHLSRTAPLRDIAFVNDRAGVFDGVLQETCLATFTRSPGRAVRVNLINGRMVEMTKVAPVSNVGPWLLPRRVEDVPVAAHTATLPLTLGEAGWKASTGPLVWNRRRDDIHARAGKGRVPIVWGADIEGGNLRRDKSRNQQRFLAIRSDRDRKTMVLDEPSILVQRTTAPEQTRRLVAAELTQACLDAWGGEVVAENHVNVLRPATPTPALSRHLMARLLASDAFDRVLRCLSGSVAVSAFELEALRLPAASVLAAWERLDDEALVQAVTECYGTN